MKSVPEKSFYERFWKREVGDSIFEGVPDWRKHLEERLSFFKDQLKGKILDAGCGQGEFALAIVKLESVNKVYGVDVSQTAIKRCQTQARKMGVTRKSIFRTASADSTSFASNFFDTIFAFEMVEHVLDTESMFSEFNRILKKGGYLGITTVDFNWLKKIIISAVFFDKYFDPRTPHIRFFTKQTLQQSLDRHGFKLIKNRWDGSYYGLMPKGQMMLVKKVK